ncbi:MAG TPA: lysylphosphatidylglycerol synthase domain-containing protein [Solirubrobacteraceae bacterium]|nr:lysylphosphatidylglycerol synthase domain-containing protein [Solirubrobacteraceae bacterium]
MCPNADPSPPLGGPPPPDAEASSRRTPDAEADALQLGTAGRKRAVAGALVTVLVGAGVWAIIGQGASFSRLSHAVQTAGPLWMVLAAAGSAIAYIGYALLYQAVCHVGGGPRPRLRLALRMTVAVFGAAVVATAAGRLGVEYWSMRKMREQPALAVARVLTLNIALWAVLAALAALAGLVALAEQASGVPRVVELVWLVVVPACALTAFVLSSPRRQGFAAGDGGRIRRTAAAVVHSLVLLRAVSSWRPLRVGGIAGALVYWVGQLLVVWAALRGFGVHIGYAAFVLGYATGYASTILPLPFGGAGGVDAATVYALTLVGVPLGPALLATLVQRVLTYWLPLGVAILFVRALRRLGRDLAVVPRPSSAL